MRSLGLRIVAGTRRVAAAAVVVAMVCGCANGNPDVTVQSQTGAPGTEATGTEMQPAAAATTTTSAVSQAHTETLDQVSQAQIVLQEMVTATRNLATNDSGARGQARDELLTLQRRTSGLAARVAYDLPSSDPARALLVAVDRGTSSAAGTLQGVRASRQDKDRLMTVAGAFQALQVHVGQIGDLVTTHDREQISSDLQSLRQRVASVS